MVNTTVAKGARTVIGFECSVYGIACNEWCKYFFICYVMYYNEEGKTLWDVYYETDRIMRLHDLYCSNDGTITLEKVVIAGETTFP